MPRNASGVYTLPGGNPVTPGDVIEASWANTTLEDVANELTNSLSRTGAGGMLAPFRIADGNISAPGLSYLNETNTGLYRSGSGSSWMAVLGVNVAQFSTVGLTIASAKSLTALGNASVGGTFGVTGATTLASTLAVTGALTATGGVLGNITAGSGTSTFNNVVINGNLDMDAGSSGTITNLPNPTNPGDAANKAYVDSQDALRLALTGGTMTGAIAMSNNKVTGVATPTADQDAANKAYVDSVAQGIDAKASCKAATTANITLSGNQTIDGVAVVAGDRVLVKNQSSAAQNGIYVADSSTWSRSADANTWDELVAAFTFVEQGTENGNNGYICTIAPGGTLGVTAVTWAQFSGAGQIIAGQGLSKTGNTIQVNTASTSRIVIGADDIDLATTGVVADTYKSVSVDAYGRVTAGTNPTTLAGFGIGDAYTQTQTNSLLAAKLSLAGGTMSGAIAMGTNKITGLGDPTTAQDAATKNYIDTIFGSTATAAASAAAAASSASAASTSATNAASSATAASGSATSAAASATSAAASYDAFDDRYLGAKASDPTVDNDGNALITGALYWNSVGNLMKTWTGTAWVSSLNPISMPDGTVNGVAYLNGSKVLTTNSGFTYDGTAMTLSSSTSYYPQIVTRNKAADNTASYYGFDKDRNGAVVQNGDVLGNLVFRGYDGTQYLQGAYINAVVNATPGVNDMPAALCFGVTPDGSAGPSEGMRLTPTGLGIGTDLPVYKLMVASGATATASFLSSTATTAYSTNSYNGGSARIQLVGGGATNAFTGINYSQGGVFELMSGGVQNSSGYADFVIQGYGRSYGGGASYYQRLKIDDKSNFILPFAGSGFTNGGVITDEGQISGIRLYGASDGNLNIFNTNTNSSYGNIIFTAGNAERARITSDGTLYMNRTTTNAYDGNIWLQSDISTWLIVNNHTFSTQYFNVFRYNGTSIGSIIGNGTSTSYGTTSDYRLKENVAPMTGALAKVAQLKPCTYTWKSNGSDGEGFIAHELAEVVPQCVTGEKDAVDEKGNPKYQGIDTSFLVATLTAAIQELKAEFDAYKATHP